jgi:hypothetical protein
MIARWRGRPWRVAWAPGHRVELRCAVCDRTFTRQRSDAFAQRQRTHTCSRVCRDLSNAFGLPKLAPPAPAQIDAKTGSPST